MRPVVVIPPQGAPRPIVVEVPHAGTGLPEEIRGELVLDERGCMRDADLYVNELYRGATAIGATLLFTEVSRFVVDLNRAPDDVDRASVPDHPAPRPDAPRGLIWRVTTDGTPTLARPLSLAQWAHRVAAYHAPYHEALDAAVAATVARFGRCVLLSGHSMPSVGKASHADPGKRRADVVPGDLEGRACAPAVTRAAVELFTAAGLSVAPNDPYKGGGTTQRHAHPERGVHALQVELNRDLYMDESTYAKREPGFARLEALCLRLVDTLAELAARL